MSSSSSTADGKPYSRNSTPATDVTPPGSPDFVLPAPSEETLRRRAQSDRASSEIGNRMLKGWAMLSDECPNDDCWAIPLVRPPRARPGAEPDPRKECVICGAVYITDEFGLLVAQPTTASQPSTTPQPADTQGPSNEAASHNVPKEPRSNGATQRTEILRQTVGESSTLKRILVPQSSAISSFAAAEDALGGALDILSQRLVQISSATDLNTKQMKDTTEAMEVVMRALNAARLFKAN
ncbi:hypothetical protein CTheo_1895 [Ceratobasidium theobromae]|uniref:Uncharacterized protein n=1 Tax=Ceratobasidium theobromae TaxID=1582974 RepID=A0A5N5QSX8_9AGAM|nr:hypothetical protein CTheo_1895 [Ceratobasidium theobromae]